jgi:hypothetical protein
MHQKTESKKGIPRETHQVLKCKTDLFACLDFSISPTLPWLSSWYQSFFYNTHKQVQFFAMHHKTESKKDMPRETHQDPKCKTEHFTCFDFSISPTLPWLSIMIPLFLL